VREERRRVDVFELPAATAADHERIEGGGLESLSHCGVEKRVGENLGLLFGIGGDRLSLRMNAANRRL